MGDRSSAHVFAKEHGIEGIDKLNAAFRRQRETLNLLYSCRDCVHVNVETDLCSLEYPNEELRRADAEGWALNHQGDIVFCKYFDIT